ncbi:hypothetical protein EW145_g1328 [Phellinidium pouzarii]|uniref:Hydrophobin n=1 Tax=Phellinidium pouzarii TaxID=167371 RepID=A0A4S4LEY5_9AGAM|nr:hypothetical protein EW145_g1328 [Phellinidium pouzarii]
MFKGALLSFFILVSVNVAVASPQVEMPAMVCTTPAGTNNPDLASLLASFGIEEITCTPGEKCIPTSLQDLEELPGLGPILIAANETNVIGSCQPAY